MDVLADGGGCDPGKELARTQKNIDEPVFGNLYGPT
jgi:hypothetical protein